jgi:hypothetical protein
VIPPTAGAQAGETPTLLRWAADGGGPPELLGDLALATGRPHGLFHNVEAGTEYLYHINDGKVDETHASALLRSAPLRSAPLRSALLQSAAICSL